MKAEHTFSLILAHSRWGRVLLHLRGAISRPDHFGWHWRGIRRELVPGR